MINVLFFADLREAAGSEKVSVEADGLSVSELKTKLLSSYELNNLDHAMVAVNEEYSQDDTLLKRGDVVAFIPPVSGG
ncbi:molybdopterin converting factor subunit 1 [Lentibacillus cibarius]|uniref:Molybdopterin synthase sulfur carrier subunit n=1 Tax=Lentibacillus cibarius TaxID=2583219 RepID=A0A549YJ39_9BACI|nr:molybdopterin converting factor subunit 1 [Lentibacillus cibarius]TMN23895.1 molybdopterin converting factor subunit 1 [Lentibacillus cibarius]TRM11899.1 molybdopterin converting factor subunit 1 [Lentibacillus cibarius]